MNRTLLQLIFPLIMACSLKIPAWASVDLTSGPPSRECLKSKSALQSASVIVYGEDLTNDNRQMNIWCGRAKEVVNAQYNAGLKFSEAVAVLKGLIKHDTKEQANVIERVFMEVMGRGASPDETAFWQPKMRNEGKWWYATMHGELVSYVNKENPEERKGVIRRAYMRSLGRDAKPEEQSYWLPRTEHFRLIREANRTWLYSANGAKELPDVVKRVFKSEKDRWPSESELKELMVKFGGQKLTFEEMRKKL